MTVFALPDLGEGLQEAELVAWHVAAGDHVVADQPLASVETEKAVVEIPSPRAGRVKRLCAVPGDRIKVGAALVEFEDAAHADEGAIVGELPERKPAAPAPLPAPAAKAAASPAVRALARQLGVDLAAVAGSGVGGTITRADVEAAAQRAAEPAKAPSVAGERLSALQRAMARNMARAHAEIVPATVSDDVDVDSWPDSPPVTLRLVRAVVAGAKAEPALNAWYDGRAETLERRATVDIGVAVDTEAGLIVPVLRDAGGRSGADLAAELRRLTEGARSRTLPPADLRGASITLSNFGAIAGRYGQLVIVPPQVAILGAGRLMPRVVAGERGPVVHRVLPLSLTFDHRAVTGGQAARFLAAVMADLGRAA
ncbi:MAG: 2-oxo acid dehydrogenase subunit E2 [Alphaproteobacteria bacterium]|nr:2-oxo acid dehydrogenase subunit E2 [Alphaproteobacteria bacterium]